MTHVQSEWILHSAPQLLIPQPKHLVLFAIVCVVCVDDQEPISVARPRPGRIGRIVRGLFDS
jgi:hypothetical protein